MPPSTPTNTALTTARRRLKTRSATTGCSLSSRTGRSMSTAAMPASVPKIAIRTSFGTSFAAAPPIRAAMKMLAPM